MIKFPDKFDMLRGHLPEDSDSNAWSWEWVAHNKVFVNAELETERAHFVLEQLRISVSRDLELCVSF